MQTSQHGVGTRRTGTRVGHVSLRRGPRVLGESESGDPSAGGMAGSLLRRAASVAEPG